MSTANDVRLDIHRSNLDDPAAIGRYLASLGLEHESWPSPPDRDDDTFAMAQESYAAGLSLVERLPNALVYAPCVLYWLWLAMRYGGVSSVTAVNPGFEMGGLVGESKESVFEVCRGVARDLIAPYVVWNRPISSSSLGFNAEIDQIKTVFDAQGLAFPIVAKGSLGCRGHGVYLLANSDQLREYVRSFPYGAGIVFQRLVPYHNEAAIFYVRHPHETVGKITSMARKFAVTIKGDGHQTVESLLQRHPRAHRWVNQYAAILGHKMRDVLPVGRLFVPHFSRSHRLGTVCKDATADVTPALTQAINAVASAVDGFFFGRFDVRFASYDALRAGKEMTILEINGASSEPMDAWDPAIAWVDVYRKLFPHYQWLFEIGKAQQARGHHVTALPDILKRWRQEANLLKGYPRHSVNFARTSQEPSSASAPRA